MAAEHFQVDSLIHYGRACLSPVRRLPVFFVFGRQPLDVTDCISQLKVSLQDDSQYMMLLYDVVYHQSMSEFKLRKLLLIIKRYLFKLSVF